EDRYAGPCELHDLPTLARGDAADDLCPGTQHPLGVFAAFRAGHALDDDFRIGVEKDCHDPAPQLAASSAALRAAPSIVSTCSSFGSSAAARICRPSSALLPSSRTTSGTSTCSSRLARSSKACTIPFATASQAVIPPKTFTKTLFT